MKVLVVFLNGNIFKPKAGNETRIYHIVRQLCKYNEVITLESSVYKKEVCNLPVKARYFVNPIVIKGIRFGTFFAALNPSYILTLLKVLRKERPELLHVSYPFAVFITKALTKILHKGIVVYEAHDVEVKRSREVILKDPSFSFLKKWISYVYTYITEKLACMFADYIITVSREDADYFIKHFSVKKEKISVISTGTLVMDLEKYNKTKCREKLGLSKDSIIIVFHGAYKYYPNAEAIKLITNYIAPRIHEKFRDVLFVIAGKDVPKYEKEGIKFLGFVENLTELLVASDIAIVPILRGGGTRVKIMDYMSAGLPIVTTKKGIEGIEAENYKHAIIVETVDEELLRALELLIENDSERKRLGRNARKLAEEKYDWDKIGDELNKLYKSLNKRRH